MLIEYTDFNNQNEDLTQQFPSEWMEVEQTLCSMPFLLNNIIRSEVLFKSKLALNSHSVALIVLVTKFDILPSANSSLHYTQAVEQLLVIETSNIFSLPIMFS
ncbi:hypothetical protein K4A83_12290 [Spirulina subsalsa FACHB-351]|uniref:Uncharacterized protein n=1 Tax=Spirulina subsalsa FACHB-351 TaxID=234711 RepID=A0ABT3L6A2_9CYAN|nr:hypothetical protein [Spirulina subsalsa]MCW6037040.1 hypothetical protein [Spirulina subsalsa FACHB-351]